MRPVAQLRLVRILDRMADQDREIVRLRGRNEELELLLRSAIQELAVASEELPSRYRRVWLSLHDPSMAELREMR